MSGRMALVFVGIAVSVALVGPGPADAQDPVTPSTTAAAAGPVYPNFLVEFSRDFLASVGTRSKDKNDTINQNQDKVHTTGSQVTNTQTHAELVPCAECGRGRLVLYGVTNAETTSQRGRVHLGHSTQISYISHKDLLFDEFGIHEAPASTQPHLEFNHLNYLNADFRLPIRPLVKRIAQRAYEKQKPKLNAEITKSAGEQLSKEFNEEADNEIKHFNERYLKDFRQPMIEKKVFPQKIRMMTSEHQMGIRALLLDPTGKAMNILPVPDVYGWPDVAVRVEESILNNFSHSMFAGKTFTGEELDDEFNRLIGPLIGPVKTSDTGEKSFTITFAKEKPIEFHFKDQKFSVTLRGDEYTTDGREFDGMYTTANYKLRKTELGLIAEREGDLVIYPPGFVPGKDKLGVREKVLQQLLDRKFSKVFKPVFEMKEVKLPESLNTKDVLVTTQVESDKGWLTLGWRRVPKGPQAPGANPPVLQPK
jgi:hypothetical protein